MSNTNGPQAKHGPNMGTGKRKFTYGELSLERLVKQFNEGYQYFWKKRGIDIEKQTDWKFLHSRHLN